MIVGNIDGTSMIDIADRRFKMVFDKMRELTADSELGKTEMQGDEVYYTVMEIDSAPLSEKKYEAHKRYIDVHYVIKGEEAIGMESTRELGMLKPYSAEKDCMFYRDGDAMSTVILKEGDFCVLYPGEAHKPGGYVSEFKKIKKAVFKIKV